MNPIVNQDQSALWNGPAGQNWVAQQSVLDTMFAPFEALLADAAHELQVHDVIDIGCGAGATTLAIARRLDTAGSAVGADISAPLIEHARFRARQSGSAATFVLADAQAHDFGARRFDLVVSRFGVMFFDDPIAAFANLRRAMRDRGALRCIVFRSPADNPFMTTAERAAAPLLPALPPRRPDAPGQFAFADAARVTKILQAGGWGEVALTKLDVTCRFAAADLERYFTNLGPVSLALRESDAATRERVIDAVRLAFAPFVDGAQVSFVAACWMISAAAARPRVW
jgi:SAM-dependent methyltransferase